MSPELRELLLNVTALVPPDGIKSNLVNPANLSDVPSAIAQLTLATLVVWIRLYTKVRVVKTMSVEDYILLISWLLYAGAWQPIVFLAERLPLGVHQWDMTIRTLIRHLFVYQFGVIIYSILMLPLKTAIILQIMHIFLPQPHYSRTPFWWLATAFLWLNILFYITVVFFQIFSCRPVAKAWDVLLDGHCADRLVLHMISGGINMASDFLMLIFPCFAIWRLTLNTKKKIGLSAVFAVGIFACISSALRLHYSVLLYHSDDVTYHAALMAKWAEPEFTCGFLVACLPILPRFFNHLRSKPLYVKISAAMKSRTRSSSYRAPSTTVVASGNANSGKGSKDRHVVTDIEFEELVARQTIDRIEDRSLRSAVHGDDRESEEVRGSIEQVDLRQEQTTSL